MGSERAQPVSRVLWIRLARAAVPLLAVIGMGISAYLTYVHLENLVPICGELGDCEVVNSSVYSAINGIPVAAIGFLGYAVLFVLGLFNLRRERTCRSTISLAILGLSLGGVLYSAYLTYIELFVLNAICVWCVGSAVTITIIFGVSISLLRPFEDHSGDGDSTEFGVASGEWRGD